jgi:hypothetical protein
MGHSGPAAAAGVRKPPWVGHTRRVNEGNRDSSIAEEEQLRERANGLAKVGTERLLSFGRSAPLDFVGEVPLVTFGFLPHNRVCPVLLKFLDLIRDVARRGRSFGLCFRFLCFPCLLPRLRCIELWAPPSLLYQERQVVDPIVFTNPAWVDNVAQVVFGIRDNKIGVGN